MRTVHGIHQSLLRLLPRKKIYFDKNDIFAGVEIPVAIRQQIESSRVVVIPIGRDWLKLLHDRQAAEKANPDHRDWHAWEIEIALKRGQDRMVIPVYLQPSIPILQASDLPENIKPLANRSALKINQEANDLDFDRDLIRLADTIRSSLPKPDSIFRRIVRLLDLYEDKVWAVATIVGNSLLERFRRVRPVTPYRHWILNLPLDLFALVSPIALCFHSYFVMNADWISKLGPVIGQLVSWGAALVLAMLAPLTPINAAIYIQNRDVLSEGFYRTIRGVVATAMLAWIPIIYLWIWWLDKSGAVPWLSTLWRQIFQKGQSS